MNDISQSIQSVMSNYDQHSTELHHSGGLQGAAGMGNLSTSAQILEAQARIQHRFQALNDLVRQAAHGYTSTDENNAQAIQAVVSHLRHV
jgi:uncharacterized protein YukE